jgi:hypothetical protein
MIGMLWVIFTRCGEPAGPVPVDLGVVVRWWERGATSGRRGDRDVDGFWFGFGFGADDSGVDATDGAGE